MSRILVVGAAGRVGRALVPLLRERGHEVVAGSARADALPALDAVAGRATIADPRRPDTIREAAEGADGVFLATGDARDQDAVEAGALAAITSAGRPFTVKLSAQSAGLSPPVSFGVQHAAAEAALRRSGLPHAVLRPVFFQQSLLLMANDARKGRLVAPTGRGRAAMVDARDVAASAAAILDRPAGHDGTVHELTGPEAMSFGEVAARIGRLTGRGVRHVSPPAFLARRLLPLMTDLDRFAAGQVVDLMRAIAGGAQATVTDTVERLTGRSPRSVDAFLAENEGAFAA